MCELSSLSSQLLQENTQSTTLTEITVSEEVYT